jgi:hypothetical protein
MTREIYEVEEKIIYIIDNNTDENGVLDEEVTDQFEALNMERKDLIKELAHSVINEKAFADSIDLEIKKLQEKKRITLNKAERLKNWVQMNIKEGEKFKEDTFTIGWRKSSSVNAEFADPEKIYKTDPNAVLNDYVKKVETVEYIIDKKKIKEGLKAKQPIPTGITVDSKNTMYIK